MHRELLNDTATQSRVVCRQLGLALVLAWDADGLFAYWRLRGECLRVVLPSRLVN